MRALRTIIVVLLVSLGFLGGYFVGWYLHGENTVRLSPAQQSTAKEAGQLQQRIIEELQGRYYKPVDVNDLSDSGVNGMLKSLKDPYTVYLTPKETREFEEKERGEYSGIGASLQKNASGLVITGVFDGSPAKAAGLVPGDVIVTVDGKPTKGVAIETSISRIKGEEGTTVKLGIDSKGKGAEKQVSVVRRRIEIPETRDRLIRDKGVKVGYVQLYDFGGYASRDVRRDVEALAAAIRRFYAMGEAEYAPFAGEAVRHVRDAYDVRRCGAQLRELYGRAVRARGRGPHSGATERPPGPGAQTRS